jgi:hypothetical protein
VRVARGAEPSGTEPRGTEPSGTEPSGRELVRPINSERERTNIRMNKVDMYKNSMYEVRAQVYKLTKFDKSKARGYLLNNLIEAGKQIVELAITSLDYLSSRWGSQRMNKSRPITGLRSLAFQERGDVPGWVLVVLMTTGLVTAIWAIAAPKLNMILKNSLDSMSNIR